MTTGFARMYGGLFLATQALGLVLGAAALAAPNLFLTWMVAPGSTHMALIMIGLSLAWPFYVWRARLAWVLLLLPLYHLGGLVGMEIYMRRIIDGILQSGVVTGGDAPVTAVRMAMQDPDLAMVSLAHSAFGLIGGLQLMMVAARWSRVPAMEPPGHPEIRSGTAPR
jgi:hypothetical protein